MGWDVYFDGRITCRRRASTWLAQPLVAPVTRLPIELEWPAMPPARARDASKWFARMARPHGDVSFEVGEQAITLKGQLSEDGVRSCFAVVLAVAERLAAEAGSGRIELVSAGKGDDFGRAIVASRKALTVVPLDDIDEATARLIGTKIAAPPTGLLHRVLGVTAADHDLVRPFLTKASRLDARALLREIRAAADECDQLAAAIERASDARSVLRRPWAYSAAGSGALVGGVIDLVARTAHDGGKRDAAAIDRALIALLRADAPLLRQTAAMALAHSKDPAAYDALTAAQAAAGTEDAFTSHFLALAIKRSRVPKRLRAS